MLRDSVQDGPPEGRTLSVELPVALDEWLTERSAELDIDRSELAARVLGGYRAAAVSTGEGSTTGLEAAAGRDLDDLDTTIQERVEEAVAATGPDEAAVAERVASRLDDRIDQLETETGGKLDDVRRRVVQLKEETGAKADDDHTHPELDRIEGLTDEVATLRERVADLEADGADDLAEDVADIETKLTRIARGVTRLHAARGGESTLDDVRRVAAREGYERADCEACGESVSVGLLPELRCPHCDQPFERITEGSGGMFGSSARLVGPRDAANSEPTGDGNETPGEGGNDE
jgi:polyhydroxyalkanoate synthesis regulator phasin